MQTCGCITAENEVKGLNHTAPSPLLKLGLSCSECFTQCVQLLNITGPEWIHTHTHSALTFSPLPLITPHTQKYYARCSDLKNSCCFGMWAILENKMNSQSRSPYRYGWRPKKCTSLLEHFINFFPLGLHFLGVKLM